MDNSEPVDDDRVQPLDNYSSIAKEVIDEAFELLQTLAQQEKIATAIVCSKRELIKLLQSYLQNPGKLKGKLASGWRFRLFGQKILDFIPADRLHVR